MTRERALREIGRMRNSIVKNQEITPKQLLFLLSLLESIVVSLTSNYL